MPSEWQSNAPVIVTGCAGFIGAAVAQRLLQKQISVIGIDNLNDYYDVNLKQGRLQQLETLKPFTFYPIDIKDNTALTSIFAQHKPKRVVHLAAQAGVRYSLENPQAYVDSNLSGFVNILEACRHYEIEHLVYASSSSVYGANAKMPYAEMDRTDRPLSLYAATKKSNEMLAHAYSHLFKFAVTGLRYFTVYGPWGRPDMAPFKFVAKVLNDEPIQVYNHGQHRRDFTYIDDIVEGTLRILIQPPDPQALCRIFNIGCGQPVELLKFIEIVEACTHKSARKEFLPQQPGDVLATWCDITKLTQATGYQPHVNLEEGIARFVEWYQGYYKLS